MRSRFIRVALLAVVVALLAASILTAILIEHQYATDMRNQLDAVLAISAGRLENVIQTSDPDYDAFTDMLSAELTSIDQDVRVTIIAMDGQVLGDSATDALDTLENHGQRPEVINAIQTGWGYDQRGSTVVDTRLYYAAYRVSDVVLRVATPMENLLYIRWLLAGFAVIGIVVGLAVAAVTVTPIIRRITRPIESMSAAALTYASGSFDTRMKPAPDELGRLSTAFNDMASQLSGSYIELEQTNHKLNSLLHSMDDGILAVDTDGHILILTERLRDLMGQPADERNIQDAGHNYQMIRDVLREAAVSRTPTRREIGIAHPEERLLMVFATPLYPDWDEGSLAVVSDVTHIRKLERIRSEFVSNVTHELKTPLTSIRGYVELLKESPRDPQTASQFYEIIEIEAERLQALVEDLLQLSEIEDGRMETSLQSVPLAAVAADVVNRLSPVAEKKEVSIHTNLDSSLSMKASPIRMEQLLYNLIDNAIKYNRPGGDVSVSLYRERKFIVIDIADTGVGIPVAHQERIFERFYRVDKSRSREQGGTGLGLSIVKHIVSLYGGDVHLVSEPDKGSRFIVRFP